MCLFQLHDLQYEILQKSNYLQELFVINIFPLEIMHAVSLANHLRAVADAFISTTEQLRGESHKSEVLLIANRLLVVKAKICIGTQSKCTK